jgi:hypothetical protein
MPGVVRGVARTAVVAGTASAVSGRVHHRQQQKWAEQGTAQTVYVEPAPQYQQPAPAPPAPPPAEDNTLDQLEKLADLKSKGILTEEEFAVQKARILGI